MQVRSALSQSIIPVDNPTTVDLLLRFRAEGAAIPTTRRALNISLVIDRSGSMAGRPLQQALRAAQALVDQLTPDDILSVVTYDDHITTILPPQTVSDPEAIKVLIGRVHAGGTTNLSGGWLKGCEHVQAHPDKEKIHRVLLLTDGQANAGVTDSEVLIRTARQKADAGIVTTTLGFGTSFNEDLLIGMARAAGGNFYFIQTPDDAAEVFRIELESLKSVAAQNLTIAIPTTSAAILNHVLSNYRTETVDGNTIIAMGDVYAGEDKLLALEMKLPAQTGAGTHDLFKVAYVWETADANGMQSLAGETAIQAQYGTIEEAISAVPETDVIQQISRIRIASAKDAAIERADKGDYQGAADLLHALIAELKGKGLNESFEIAEELDNLEFYAQKIESRQFDSASRKEMRDQSHQARVRTRDDLSLRSGSSGSAQGLETVKETDVTGQGVLVRCHKEGGKLRVHALSDGYDPQKNVQFPRSIREEGVTYLVEELKLSTDGGFYHSAGKIRRVLTPGQENRYSGQGRRTGPKSDGKAANTLGTAADLPTTDAVGDGVLVQCVKEGSKLRARVVSDGYDPNWNMRFPRSIREEGILYVVDEVLEVSGGGQYMACGKIRRLVQPV